MVPDRTPLRVDGPLALVEPQRVWPSTGTVEGGELVLAGVPAAELARTYGTPLVVYCEQTLRERARAYRRAAPDALVAYGTKAFANVEVLRMLAEEGLGADVSTLGELVFALRAGIPAAKLVVHGNNKTDEELQAAASLGAGLVVLDAFEEVGRAVDAGVRTVLLRVNPGIEAATHHAIRTAHPGSKFGLARSTAEEAVASAIAAGLDVAGFHVHVGSQLLDVAATIRTIDWLARLASTCRQRLGWSPRVVDLGGGLGISHNGDEVAPSIDEFTGAVLERIAVSWRAHGQTPPRLVLEPGRSIVGPAAVTLYTVGVVKQAVDGTTYVAIDGGISDNPRPQLYGACHTALVANRADAPATGTFAVAGRHCESGDVLIDSVPLAGPRRGDLLAVPATGAYTLSMASTYNGVPRPAAVLVARGEARLIRRRETVEDLLAFEA